MQHKQSDRIAFVTFQAPLARMSIERTHSGQSLHRILRQLTSCQQTSSKESLSRTLEVFSANNAVLKTFPLLYNIDRHRVNVADRI